MTNFILLMITFLLVLLFGSISFIYSIIKRAFKGVSFYFYKIAFSLDQTSNTICQDLFNDLLIFSYGHRFGNPDETLSHVLGVNKEQNTLYPLGRLIAALVNIIAAVFFKDFNHVEKAAKKPQ